MQGKQSRTCERHWQARKPFACHDLEICTDSARGIRKCPAVHVFSKSDDCSVSGCNPGAKPVHVVHIMATLQPRDCVMWPHVVSGRKGEESPMLHT